METWMFDQPGPHVRMLVSGVVVADQVDLQTAGNVALDRAQEREELLVPMPGWALADDRAGQHIQRREQPRRAGCAGCRGSSWPPGPVGIGSDGWVRSGACADDFSSGHNSIALSGELRY